MIQTFCIGLAALLITIVSPLAIAQTTQALTAPAAIEQWGVFETAFDGPSDGNPFIDVTLTAKFTSENQPPITVHGFYDGDGKYIIRFMPPTQGNWIYETRSNRTELYGKHGAFLCVAPWAGNHGPVRVANTYHFAYADGTPYVEIGTTCYGWAAESTEHEQLTLQSLRNSPFDKVRMTVITTKREPNFYPYVRHEDGTFDQARFNPAFFHNFENCVSELSDAGIQADLILFHPYKKGDMEWFDRLDNDANDRYIRYMIARFAAYRNVWWSLANEYGQIKYKTDDDWDHFFQVVQADDPYQHLRGIHNAYKFYDSNKPWVTHASIQNGNALDDFGRAVIHRELWRKPVVFDEVCYEGNIDRRWGKLTGEEMTRRFWIGTISGTYVGHGETLSSPEKMSWTSNGGRLMGESPARLGFLRKVLEAGPADGIEPIDESYESNIGGRAGRYYLVYFGNEKPTSWTFALPRDPPHKAELDAGQKYHVDILDTWNMTTTPVDRVFVTAKQDGPVHKAERDGEIALPGLPYIAIRIERIKE